MFTRSGTLSLYTSAVRTALKYAAFPVLMVGGTLATFALARVGLKVPLAATAVGLCVFLVIFGLERLIPHRPEWNAPDGQFGNDIGHTLFGTALGAAAGDFLNTLWAGALAGFVSERVGSALWPTSWPLVAQVVLVYLVADLGRYAQHRLHHGVPALWRYHELHHSGEALTAIKSSRSHAVERILQQVFMFGPLIILGVPADVLWWFVVPNSFLGSFSHSNADFRLGVLEYVFMGPKNHRLHHSAQPEHFGSNFSSATVVWDVIFGTWTNPYKTPSPVRVGIDGDVTPRGFFAQIVEPLRRRGRTNTSGAV